VAETRTADEVRGFVHKMWASVAEAWGREAEQVDHRAAAITDRIDRKSVV